MKIPFTKMHGLGNDFVIIDATKNPYSLTPVQIRHLADRHFGVGCDQVLFVESSPEKGIDFFYRIFNADGGEAKQCGNGLRCITKFLLDKGLTTKHAMILSTPGGVRVKVNYESDQIITVDMGKPNVEVMSQKIPLSEAIMAGMVSIGNRHAVLLVNDVDQMPISEVGPEVLDKLANSDGINLDFMEVIDRSQMKLRTYENGTGETLACGSGSCASVTMGILWGLLDKVVTVHLKGGDLEINWPNTDASLIMKGPAATAFEGIWELKRV